MWLLRLPVASDQRVHLPPGRHLFPWHFEREETSRLAELLTGLLAGVNRHLIVPLTTVDALARPSQGPVMASTLLVVKVDDPSIDDPTIDRTLARVACPHAMLQTTRPRERGYAWQERYLKPALLTLLNDQISDDEHPLASLNISALPLRLAASLATDVLGLLDLLEDTAEHRFAHATEGTSDGDYESSLYAVAGRRFAERLLRLLPYQLEAALDVLRTEGVGRWSDERFRAGAHALEDVGLAQVAGGSVSLEPVARSAKDPRVLRVLRETLASRLPIAPTRRWVVETAPALDGIPTGHATRNLVSFVGEAVSTAAELLHVLRGEHPIGLGPIEGIGRVKNWIRDGEDFHERCRRAGDFLSDPDRSMVVRTNRHSDYDIWLEPIAREFTEDEWRRINSIYVDDLRYDELVSPARKPTTSVPDPRSVFRGFSALPRDRFSSQSTLPRQFDAFLGKRPDLSLDLASWMTFALRGSLTEESLTDAPEFLDAVSWIWRSVVENSLGGHGAREEARRVILRSLAIALKNGHELQRKHIENDATTLGIDISTVDPAGERPADFLEKMKEGFETILNSAFPMARVAYAQAGAIARERGDSFGEWAALHGEEDAALASLDLGERATPEAQSVMGEYRRRCDAIEDVPKIREWMAEARRREEQITQLVIDGFVRQRRHRTAPGRGMSFSNAPHEYWTMFRDLETIHASPTLQRRYVQPLIDAGGFNPDTELHYRLQLDVDKTESAEDWLGRITDDPQGTVAERHDRYADLLTEFTRTDTTKIERVRRLEVFPKVAPIFRRDELDWAFSFLMDRKKEFQSAVTTFVSMRTMGRDHARGWRAYADLETRVEVLDRLEAYAATIEAYAEAEEFSREFDRLPLAQWVGLHTSAPERLIHLAFGLDRSSRKRQVVRSDEHLAWALGSIVVAVRRFQADLPEPMWNDVRSWAATALRKQLPDEHSYLSGAFNASVHLAWAAASGDAGRDTLVKEALALTSEIPYSSFRRAPALEVPISLWVSLVQAGARPTDAAMADTANVLWMTLDAAWDETLRFVRSNPHHAWPYVAFVAGGIASGAAWHPSVTRDRLLQLIQAAPGQLPLCAQVLEPTLWEDRWQRFVDLVWRSSTGGDGSAPIEARLGAVGLLTRWLGARSRTGSGELPPDLGFLVEMTLLAVADESPGIANHAAYAIVGYASRARSLTDVQRVAGVLGRMASDPRVVVRGAAAYAGTKVPFMDVADEVRAASDRIDRALSGDPYAIIQRQRVFGELDGKAPPP